MYDINNINSVSELEELILDMNLVINNKKSDSKVKKHCIETRTKALRKLEILKKHNGM